MERLACVEIWTTCFVEAAAHLCEAKDDKRDDESAVKELALDLPRVKALVDGQTVRRVIYVPGRVLNLVVS